MNLVSVSRHLSGEVFYLQTCFEMLFILVIHPWSHPIGYFSHLFSGHFANSTSRDKQTFLVDGQAEPSRAESSRASRHSVSAADLPRVNDWCGGSAAKARAVMGDNSWRRANKRKCRVRRSDRFNYSSSTSFCFFSSSARHFPQKR